MTFSQQATTSLITQQVTTNSNYSFRVQIDFSRLPCILVSINTVSVPV